VRDGGVFPLPQRDKYIFLTGGCYIYTLPGEYRKENSQQIKTRDNERKREQNGAFVRYSELLRDLRNYPFPVRFKGSLNILIAVAGLRLLLCRFCVFSLPVGAIPVGGSGWGRGRLSSSGAGAVVSAAGEALLPGMGRGVYQGVAEKQGVSLARGIGLIYTHPLSPSKDLQCSCGKLCRHSLWVGGAEKGGGGFYVEHYENN
jgi:hypothetical protein